MKKNLLSWALALLAGLNAHGALLLSDSFSYPDGPLIGAPGSPWLAYSSAGSGPVLVTTGRIHLSGGNSEDVQAPLFGAPYTTNSAAVLYSSFKVKVTSSPGFNGTYFAHFKDTNTGSAAGEGARIWISQTNTIDGGDLPSGKFRFGIGNGVLATNSSGQIGTDLTLNTTNLLVTRFVPATGLATLWLNPTAESDPSVTANDAGTILRPNPIDVVAYAFRQASGEGGMLIDDLRVGTTFNDVVSTNTPPTITTIPGQSTGAGVPTPPIPFTVGDLETPAEDLALSASSSNPSLVADAGIVFGGGASNRTVTITPQPGQQGFAAITITVTDADGGFSSTPFQLAVGVPILSAIPNQITPTNTPLGPITFMVSDTEAPAGDLIVTAASANQTLLPNANIVLGGAGSDRSITLTPAADQAGLATVMVAVSDGTSSSSNSFVLTVYPCSGCSGRTTSTVPTARSSRVMANG